MHHNFATVSHRVMLMTHGHWHGMSHVSIQCLDTVGWATGRASGLQKVGCCFDGGVDLTGTLHSFIVPVVTTTSIILSSFQQNPEWRHSGTGWPSSSGKWPLEMERKKEKKGIFAKESFVLSVQRVAYGAKSGRKSPSVNAIYQHVALRTTSASSYITQM